MSMHELWSIGANNNGQQGIGAITYTNNYKLNYVSTTQQNMKITNIVTGRNGSTYIIANDGDTMLVMGCNDCGQLGITIPMIIDRIINYWYVQSSNHRLVNHIVVIPLEVLHTIMSFVNKNWEQLDKIVLNDISIPFCIDKFDIKLISNGIHSSHKFILTKQNKLWGCGNNRDHQLGNISVDGNNKDTANSDVWIEVLLPPNVQHIKQISCTDEYSTFLTQNGDVYTCGYSCCGGLGLGENIKNADVLKKVVYSSNKHTKAVTICCGRDHTLMIDENNDIYGWGWNENGQTGHSVSKSIIWEAILIKIGDDVKFKQVACGSDHSVVLSTDGKVYCFGDNSYYQCGICSTDICLPTMNATLSTELIIDIKCGSNHNMAKTVDNKYLLWGNNQYKQCLMNIEDHIKIPTVYSDTFFKDLNKKIVDMYLGYRETRIVVMKQ